MLMRGGSSLKSMPLSLQRSIRTCPVFLREASLDSSLRTEAALA